MVIEKLLSFNDFFSGVFGVSIISGMTMVIRALIKYQKKQKEESNSLKEAVRSLLHSEIFTMCDLYISRGYVTVSEYNNLHHLYLSYKAMGGDGAVEDLMFHVKQLLKKESEKYD